MTAPDPGVYISPSQMYQEVRALADGMGRVEGKLDEVLREASHIREDVLDHEKRIRALEAAPKPADLTTRVQAVESLTWRAAGASAAIATCAGVFIPLIFR
ncbi:hypothetical protein ACWDXD_33350 [Streptomyces sp. NPDC003314]